MKTRQPLQQIASLLSELADRDHYLFSLLDLQAIIPRYPQKNLKEVVRRMEQKKILQRLCRGLYLYRKVDYPRGLLLYHAAAKLRAKEFNYLSLESVLSDARVISQMPINWITLISSGRSHTIDCGEFGHIEFIHTKRLPQQQLPELTYDAELHLWRASVKLALHDMKMTHRKSDLINNGDRKSIRR